MRRLLLAGLAVCAMARAEGLDKSFPPGGGSRFQLQAAGFSGDVVISVAAAKSDRVNIEYYFSASLPTGPVEMWQQVELSKRAAGSPRLEAGYILGREMKNPERIPAAMLTGFDGLSLDAFLLNDAKEIAKFAIGRETVTVPAGTIVATHYRQTQNGTTFDYWIADEAKPLGIVKLEATGGKAGGFRVSLNSLVQNVAPKIDPAKATELTKKGQEMLPSVPTKQLP